MKKAVSVVCLLITVILVFSSCKKKLVYTDEEQYRSAISESNKEASESSSKQQSEIADDKDELSDKIGVTEENKQIVYQETGSGNETYIKIVFDKNGNYETKYRYVYFSDEDDYEKMKEAGGDSGYTVKKSHDDVMRLDYEIEGNIIPYTYQSAMEDLEEREADGAIKIIK